MPKTIFYDGTTIVTAAFLNKINNYQFVANPDDDGQRGLILDSELSNDPGQIKQVVNSIANAFRITALTGRQVSYSGGVVTLDDWTTITIAPGTLVLPDNATSFIFINSAGAIAQATVKPSVGIPLARAVVASGSITNLTLLFNRALIQPSGAPLNSPVFTGSPQAPTPPLNDNSQRVATTAFAQGMRSKLLVSAGRATQFNFPAPTTGRYYTIPWNQLDVNVGSAMTNLGVFTVPATDWYRFEVFLRLLSSSTTLHGKLALFGEEEELATLQMPGTSEWSELIMNGVRTEFLTAGSLITVRGYVSQGSGIYVPADRHSNVKIYQGL